jgi:hypothetical protein
MESKGAFWVLKAHSEGVIYNRCGVSETVSESTDRVVKNSGELERIVLINQVNTRILLILNR